MILSLPVKYIWGFAPERCTTDSLSRIFFFDSFISLQDLEPSYPPPGILQPPSGWSLLQRYIIGISNFLPILVHSPCYYKFIPCSKCPISYY